MSIFIGTAYFCSNASAIDYFAKEETDKKSVEEYIKEGLIYIGKPNYNPKLKKLSLDKEGRYWLEEKENDK